MMLFVLCFALFAGVHGNIPSGTAGDGGKAFRITLNNGATIPTLGLGTFLGFDEKGQLQPKPGEVTQAVEWAMESGYRLIDTAALYGNEGQIGAAIENSIASGKVRREDLFIVTKLASTRHARAQVLPALRESLRNLKLEHVDLFLIHTPMGFTIDGKFDTTDYLDTWRGMEEVHKLGLAKSIGLSNFNISQIQRILDNCVVKPSVLQVEVNLNLRQAPLVDFCKANGIVVMAYTPFGSLFGERPETQAPPPRSDDPVLRELASKYNRTVPQIVLRYLVQRGVVPIPKSVHQNRIQENIDIFSFQLTPDEIQSLDGFNRDYRVVWPSFWQDHPYYPFEKTDHPIKSPF